MSISSHYCTIMPQPDKTEVITQIQVSTDNYDQLWSNGDFLSMIKPARVITIIDKFCHNSAGILSKEQISAFFHTRSPGVVIGRWDFLSIRLHLSQQGLALVGCWLNLSRLLISWQKVRIQGEIDYHLLDNLEIEKMFENDARFKELNMTEFIFKTIPDITVVRIQYVDRFTQD